MLLRADRDAQLRVVMSRVDEQRLSWTNDVTVLPDGGIAFTTTASERRLDEFVDKVLEHRGSGLSSGSLLGMFV